jgi:hypothetical protein
MCKAISSLDIRRKQPGYFYPKAGILPFPFRLAKMNLVHDVTLHITRFWFVLTTIGFVFLNCGAKVISSPSVPASVVQSEAADLKKRHPSPCADAVRQNTPEWKASYHAYLQ